MDSVPPAGTLISRANLQDVEYAGCGFASAAAPIAASAVSYPPIWGCKTTIDGDVFQQGDFSKIVAKPDNMNLSAVERMDIARAEDQLQVALHRLRYDYVLARLPAGQSVLEIGTGLGFFTAELFPRCASYLGVEYDATACAESRSKNPGAEIVQADARRLPFEEGRFSFIVCLEVIEHLGDWQAGVRNIYRCLHPDGTAIVSIPWRRRGGKSKINPFHLYEPGEREMVSLLERLFVNVETNYLYFEETFWMRLCRRCHLRRLFGLDKIYADLSAGLPHATARLHIGRHPRGKREGLVVTVSGKKTPC